MSEGAEMVKSVRKVTGISSEVCAQGVIVHPLQSGILHHDQSHSIRASTRVQLPQNRNIPAKCLQHKCPADRISPTDIQRAARLVRFLSSMPSAAAPPRPSNHSSKPSPFPYKSQWLFTEDELLLTPSVLAGLSASDERANRAKGVNFILQVGILLKLPQITLSTASVFLHRFFMRFSMKRDPTSKKPDYHYYSVAAAALWLAAKVEENCRKMKELVIACVRVAQKQPDKVVDEQDKEFWRWRDVILVLEDQLLEGLCFDLSLEPPYAHLYDFMVKMGLSENKSFRNAAWAFINDSVLTPICLLFPAKVIAAASMYAAARSKDVIFDAADRDDGSPWWTGMGVDIREIKKACNFMAGVYENAPLRNGAAEGMYSRTPEDDTPNGNRASWGGERDEKGSRTHESTQLTEQRRDTREMSTVSAAGSDVSKKRARDDGDAEKTDQGTVSVNDLPWGGSDERTAKRKKMDDGEKQEVVNAQFDGASEEISQENGSTNGAKSNGINTEHGGVPPEAGPEKKDETGTTAEEYTGPKSPDLGSEEGEVDE